MVTTVTSARPKEVKAKRTGSGTKFPGPNGKGPGSNGQGGKSKGRFSREKYSITTWVILASVIMIFAALSSSYIILSTGNEFQPVRVPRMFFVSTGIICLSSFSFEIAKRSLKQGHANRYLRWLFLTLVLGLLFLAAQIIGWRELARQGVFFASHPHSSFFYLFTGFHGVHLLGGMLALLILIRKGTPTEKYSQEKVLVASGSVSRYWHTMDGIWIWLLLLLVILR